MSVDLTGAAGVSAGLPLQGAASPAGLAETVQFNRALQAAEGASPAAAPASNSGLNGVLQTLERVNGESADLAAQAKAIEAHGANVTPGEMIMLTVRCNEFMFHCQLTSNIANRSSDGLQQLFRQQG